MAAKPREGAVSVVQGGRILNKLCYQTKVVLVRDKANLPNLRQRESQKGLKSLGPRNQKDGVAFYCNGKDWDGVGSGCVR